MQKITIYDIEADRIDVICRWKECSEAEVLEAIFDALDDNNIDIKDYL